MTARASAARSPPGVSRPARPRTFASAARASPPSRYWVSRTISSALPRVMIPPASASRVAAEPGGQVPRHGQQPVRRGPGLAQRQGQLVPGELVHHGGHPPRRRLEPVLGVPPEHLRDRDQLAGGHVRLGPVEGAHQPDQLMIGHPAERITRPAGVQRGVGGHRQLRAARHHIPRHPGPEPGRPARRLTREGPRRPGLPRPPPPRARRIQLQHLIGRRLSDPGQLLRGQLVLPRRRRARFGVPVLLRGVGRVVVLGAQPVQPRLPLRRGHRVAVQPGGILLPPRRFLSRRSCH